MVEDDPVIGDQLVDALRRDGHAVDLARDGEEALMRLMPDAYGLLVLDLMLPKVDGWEVCRTVRSDGNRLPILMLTARDSVADRVRGLEEGADDYLPKPFDMRELLARVHALLRRESQHRTGVIRIADLEIDTRAHTVRRGGQEVSLTPREYQLLEALARNEGRTLTRTIIMESVWGNEDLYENTVSFHVAGLRKKIDDREPKLIHTVHGIGYTLRAPG